jgi:PPOX class probable F420-dependent enzyme
MSQDEINAFLDEERVVTVATLNPNGRPHLVPLWYVRTDNVIEGWTYRRSQKVANLRRLPEATLQVEAGDSYEQLRGVTMECDVEFVEAVDAITAIGMALTRRYTSYDGPEVLSFVARQATKRVGLRFVPTSTVSWDHRKLDGAY